MCDVAYSCSYVLLIPLRWHQNTSFFLMSFVPLFSVINSSVLATVYKSFVMAAVRIALLYLKYNGSHFCLLPSSIHSLTGWVGISRKLWRMRTGPILSLTSCRRASRLDQGLLQVKLELPIKNSVLAAYLTYHCLVSSVPLIALTPKLAQATNVHGDGFTWQASNSLLCIAVNVHKNSTWVQCIQTFLALRV